MERDLQDVAYPAKPKGCARHWPKRRTTPRSESASRMQNVERIGGSGRYQLSIRLSGKPRIFQSAELQLSTGSRRGKCSGASRKCMKLIKPRVFSTAPNLTLIRCGTQTRLGSNRKVDGNTNVLTSSKDQRIFRTTTGEKAPFWVTAWLMTRADGQSFVPPAIIHQGSQLSEFHTLRIPSNWIVHSTPSGYQDREGFLKVCSQFLEYCEETTVSLP